MAGEKHGGVGPGLTARQALQAGLKVDVGALPKILVEAIKSRSVDLDKVETTQELLGANAVDDSLAKGIGRRLDGWPNRDLNVGAGGAMAPTLKPRG